MKRFADDLVARLSETREVDVETTGRRSGLTRRTTTWVVVDEGVPYVRSEYGNAGQWFQNALAEPRLTLILDGRRHAVTATLVRDPATLGRVSDQLRAKYRRNSAAGEMVDPKVEPMTLALSPTPGDAE
jgi:deazaflavin-dependent oxidoreductase (nitroreductase family)